MFIDAMWFDFRDLGTIIQLQFVVLLIKISFKKLIEIKINITYHN
jgi:hypothetical protein